ncbi:RibD family protein [Falsiroseomonas tokyonensis]|uniref:RibD family protein n=1 Tax=Falsiroseomonas tokyonensis TaxID=430521 RepID=A0ABV7BSJ9_9PROT|nr:RibD family protein [Falsiroseomonas tokyonensis]MBU8537646.1 RibD family protein [Falsiroseomonas tokyonensis]
MTDAALATETADWNALLAARADGAVPPGTLGQLFAPLLTPPTAPDGCIVIGRLAQTLDGRIACDNGSSQWIGGRGDILHTHRLRALCDVVLVGAGTVHHDDPRLTTREVTGPNPVRVVLDPQRRLPATHKVFCDNAAPTLLVASTPGAATHGQAEVLVQPDLPGLLRDLAARGLTKIFVEGGGRTVSAFLAAGLLDRLHLTVAPIILGSGIPAFSLPPANRIAQGLRFEWTPHRIGEDMLFDIALGRARPGICSEGSAP